MTPKHKMQKHKMPTLEKRERNGNDKWRSLNERTGSGWKAFIDVMSKNDIKEFTLKERTAKRRAEEAEKRASELHAFEEQQRRMRAQNAERDNEVAR